MVFVRFCSVESRIGVSPDVVVVDVEYCEVVVEYGEVLVDEDVEVGVVDPEDLHFKAASSTTGIAFLQGAKPSLMQAFFSLLLSLKLSLIVFLQSLTGLKSRTSMQAQYSLFVFSLMHVLKSSLNEVVVMLHVSFTETDGVHS